MGSFICERMFQPQDDERCTLVAVITCTACDTHVCAHCYTEHHKEHDRDLRVAARKSLRVVRP